MLISIYCFFNFILYVESSNVRGLFLKLKYLKYHNYSNNYKNCPFSKCDCDPPYSGENNISAISDLNPVDGKYPFDALGHRDPEGNFKA